MSLLCISPTVFIAAVLLVTACFRVGYCLGNTELAAVKVFNELNHKIEKLILKGSQETPDSIRSVYPQVSKHFVIPGNIKWNINITTRLNEKNTASFPIGAYNFTSGTSYVLVIYNRSGDPSFFALEVGNVVKGDKLQLEQKTPQLHIEEALLTVHSEHINQKISVYGISENCHKCDLQALTVPITPFGTAATKIDTRWGFKIELRALNGSKCSFTQHFGEYGHYRVMAIGFNFDGSLTCVKITDKEAHNKYIPIAVMFAGICGLIIIFVLSKHVLWRRYKQRREVDLSVDYSQPRDFMNHNLDSQLNSGGHSPVTRRQVKKTRLRSLDTFRGISIIIMIFVNYEGGKYWFFNHSRWNGLTVADLVFPWFIFIMGTSIVLSQRSMLGKGLKKSTIFVKIAKRSLILVGLGLFLNNGVDLQRWRMPGVLQRFGISYFVVATMNLYLSPTEDYEESMRRFDWLDSVRDHWMYWPQWVCMLGVLALYLIISFFLPVPGCPKGYFGPGGIGDHGLRQNCTGGAAGYIDKKIFGENHIYGHPTSTKLYNTGAYDPEGLLGCLTSIFLTFLGLHAGRILFTFPRYRSRIVRWLICAVVWGGIAIGLAGGTQNDGVIPINKNLWSVSFIFANAALSYILLAFCFFVIDVKHWWTGGPFYYAGMNAILLYCGHEILDGFFPFNFVANPPTHTTILARSFVGTFVWLIIAYLLFINNTFLKL